MDPNANWAEQFEIRSLIHRNEASEEDRERLEELREALNEWLSNGGFPPSAWGHTT